MNASPANARGNLRAGPLTACLLVSLATGGIASSSGIAATLQVTNCNDAGSGSLRDALARADSGDSVSLTALTCSTISLTTGELRVQVDDLALLGPGARALAIAGNQQTYGYSSVLTHVGKGTLRVEALRITDNWNMQAGSSNSRRCIHSYGTLYLDRATVNACSNGGLWANRLTARDSTISDNNQGITTGSGNVSISGSTISGNRSAHCAGLQLGRPVPSYTPTVQISNSTISGNVATGAGFYDYYNYGAGCIYGPATISNSTVAFNQGWQGGLGGLNILSPSITVESSIFAYNSGDLSSNAHVSGHNNLFTNWSAFLPADTIKTNPRLLPLADNGGSVRTHALASASPAIDAGNNLAGLANDQRGASFDRVVGARADIGAFELQAAATVNMPIGPGFTGSWFDPAQSGHGLMLEVLSDQRLLALWFSFSPEGDRQAWFGGVGTYDGGTAIISDVALPVGGRWIPDFDASMVTRVPWGRLVFTFTDCNHGKVDFDAWREFGSGSMNLTRLTLPEGLTCP